MRRTIVGCASLAAAWAGFELLARGRMTIDVGIGRRTRPLGPIARTIAAPPEVVFDVIAGPYLRTPRAMRETLRVWERGSDMVLAEHLTRRGRRVTSTVETVRFERPRRITFRLARGPVPHVSETFDLAPASTGTAFTYTGEMGSDLWKLGSWWTDRVASAWEHAVEHSLDAIQAEAERRT
jgi:hypothetical protein